MALFPGKLTNTRADLPSAIMIVLSSLLFILHITKTYFLEITVLSDKFGSLGSGICIKKHNCIFLFLLLKQAK